MNYEFVCTLPGYGNYISEIATPPHRYSIFEVVPVSTYKDLFVAVQDFEE
jgi:hypothetical protein